MVVISGTVASAMGCGMRAQRVGCYCGRSLILPAESYVQIKYCLRHSSIGDTVRGFWASVYQELRPRILQSLDCVELEDVLVLNKKP